MNIKESLANFLYDKNYYISIFDNSIYFYNYEKLSNFNDDIIYVDFINFSIKIKGNNLLIKKMGQKELLVSGIINNIDFKYE